MADPGGPGTPDPTAPRMRDVWVWRCPVCGSTDAGPDESRSLVDMTWMQCGACGEGGLCDPYEQDHDWRFELQLPVDGNGCPGFVPPVPPGRRWHELALAAPSPGASGTGPSGCVRCFDADAGVAWQAATARRVETLVGESHFDVSITACGCDQRFVSVFTERIDWVGGEDDQTWLLLPVTADEASEALRCPTEGLRELLHGFGAERRYLLRMFPTGGALCVEWRDGGFWIGPHD